MHAEHENDQIGFSANHVFDGSLAGESIDVLTGNLSLSIPVGQRFQLSQSLGYQVLLRYNSRIWQHECDPLEPSDPCQGRLVSDTFGTGFHFGFGRIYQHPEDNNNIYRYVDPSGAEHFFCHHYSPEQDYCPSDLYGITYDASSMNAWMVDGGWTLFPGDGTRIDFQHGEIGGGPQQVVQYGGWHATHVELVAFPSVYYDISYEDPMRPDAVTRIEDSAGRYVTLTYSPTEITVSMPAYGGMDTPTPDRTTWTLGLEELTIADPDLRNYPRTARFLTSVNPPGDDTVTGKHTFGYSTASYTEGSPGGNGYLNYWEIPTGAYVKYFHRHYHAGTLQPWRSELALKTLHSEGETYDWSYSRFGDGVARTWQELEDQGLEFGWSASNPKRARVLDPFGNLTLYLFHQTIYPFGPGLPSACDVFGCESNWTDGLLYEVDTYAGPSQDTAYLARRETYQYTYDGTGFEFRSGSSASGANHIFSNVRLAGQWTVEYGGGAHGSLVRHMEYKDWTTLDANGFSPTEVRRPREVWEYRDSTPYRITYTDWKPTLEFHDGYDYKEVRDASGNVLQRTDTTFSNYKLTSQVFRLHPEGATDPEGDVEWTYGYSDGNMTSKAEDYGTGWSFLNGVVWHSAGGGATVVNRSVDANTGLVYQDQGDYASNPTDFAWDELGRLTLIIPTLPERLTQITYPDLKHTIVGYGIDEVHEYEYDDLGRVVYELRSGPTPQQDLAQWREYDIAGRVVAETPWTLCTPPSHNDCGPNNYTTYDYSIANNNAQGGEPDTFTDPLGRIRKVTLPDGSVTETDYSGLEKTVTVRGIQGESAVVDATTIFAHDTFGRLVEVDAPEGADAHYFYDELDQLVRVELIDPAPPSGEPAVQVREFWYDPIGRMIRSTLPEVGTTEYLSYAGRGQLLEYRDARGNEIVNEYTSAGLLERAWRRDGGVLTPLVANVWTDLRLTGTRRYGIVDGEPEVMVAQDYEYDRFGTSGCGTSGYLGLNGRLRRISTWIKPWAGGIWPESSADAVDQYYCYEEDGRLDGMLYPSPLPDDSPFRTNTVSSARGGYVFYIADANRGFEYVSAVDYDPRGLPIEIRRGNRTQDLIERDVLGRPTTISTSRFVPSMIPDEHHRQIKLIGELVTPDPDSILDQTMVTVGGGGTGPIIVDPPVEVELPWSTGVYQYDGAGNVKGVGGSTYHYDAINRLAGGSMQAGGTTYGLSYEYDAFGNMVSATRAGNDWSNFDVDRTTNRLVARHHPSGPTFYDYDESGNILRAGSWQYQFNESNELMAVWDTLGGRVVDYLYDAAGRRVYSSDGETESFYLRDVEGQILSEYRRSAGSNELPAWDKDYIYGLGQALVMLKNEDPPPMGRPWATQVAEDHVTLNWDPVNDVDVARYVIVRESSSSSGEKYFSVDWDQGAVFTDVFGPGQVDPVVSTAVTYWITAVDTANNAGFISPPLQILPFSEEPPDPPSNLSRAETDGAIELSWDPVQPEEDDLWGYHIERRGPATDPAGLTGLAWQRITPMPQSTVIFLDFLLDNGMHYEFRVRAVDTAGNESEPSGTVTGMPHDNVPPSKPYPVAAQPTSLPEEIQVLWNLETGSDVVEYQVFRSEQPDTGWVFAGNTAAPGVSFVDGGLPADREHYYRVRAVDEAGNSSEYSDVVSAWARHPAVMPPTGFQATQTVDPGNSVRVPSEKCNITYESDDIIGAQLSWDGESGATWRIYRAAQGSDEFHRIAEVVDATEYFDGPWLANGYRYYVVRVQDVGGVLVESATTNTEDLADDFYWFTASVNGIRVFDSRTEFLSSNAWSRVVRVTWSRVPESDLRGYHVYRRCEWDPINRYQTTNQLYQLALYGVVRPALA